MGKDRSSTPCARSLPSYGAARAALVYLALGVVWILVSDTLLDATVSDIHILSRLQTIKGWFFVVSSAGVIYALVRREIRTAKREEGHFRALVEQSFAGVCVVQNKRFVYANPKLGQILGRPVRDLTELTSAEEVFSEGHRGAFFDVVAQAVEAYQEGPPHAPPPPQKLRITRSDGSERAIEVSAQAITWHDRPAVIVLIVDRTEQEALEEQLRHAQRMEAIGQLTGAIAHDFNNLLTAVSIPLELAMMEIGDDHEISRDLSDALQATRTAAQLTRQLLTFSRKRVSRPEVMDVNKALEGLENMLDRLTGETVAMRLELGEPSGMVLIDPSHLEQVLMNLVVNARDAMPDGGDITIRTKLVPAHREFLRHRGGLKPGPHAVIEVEDTGVGMDRPTQLRIFEPFFTTKEKGTGLGLPTVFGIVRQAEGFVRVKSSLGRGTRMQVYLPLMEEAPSEDLRGGREQDFGEAREARVPDRKGKTILVVEDDVMVRRQLERALRRAGYRVLAAGGGAAALRLAEQNDGPIHVLLTDLMLPDVNGINLASEFRKSHSGTAVLFFSGYSEEAIIRQLRAEPGLPFLEKPFQVPQLIEAIDRVLSGSVPAMSRRS